MKTYFFALENPFGESTFDFYKEQAAWRSFKVLEKRWLDLFPQEEKRVINELKNSTFKLPLEKSERGFAVRKINDKYYLNTGGISFQNEAKTSHLILDYYSKINLLVWQNIAIENLTERMLERLSLGDRLIVKSIAIETLDNLLETISSNTISANSNIPGDMIAELHLHEGVIGELQRYGFKIKSKVRTYY